mgnify:CR=1 FL=1
MTARRVLETNDNFNVRSEGPVHSGKVRSVYWLTAADSQRLIEARGYDVPSNAQLAVMIISDRLSAFECLWQGEGGLSGVPGKGAALNAISGYWFDCFRDAGLARSHILEVPHPLVWIVQRCEPVMIEAIARQYITGSMWRAYDLGDREFCGVTLPEGLKRDQKLPEILLTPSTKGVLTGIPGVPEADDVNVSRHDIENHYQVFKLKHPDDVAHYETLLRSGFDVISERLAAVGQIFVDTKFEFGYAGNSAGALELIYMDEVGTPDSSRIWDAQAYESGRIVENSKERFRQALLGLAPDSDLLLNKTRMRERLQFAAQIRLPESLLMEMSATYTRLAERITGSAIPVSNNPRAEIEALLQGEFGLG